jgi:formylglycine-generating enzyme required for sulfatase activity
MANDTKPKSDTPKTLRVFLCHSSGDKPPVRELYQRLCAEGIDAWLDEEKLLPGQDWQREIPKAVRASDVVIVCLSRGSITKAGYVQREIKFALDVADEQPEDAIFLIPARLEECEVPDRLSRWQWVNLYNAKGFERLMRALWVRAEALGIKLSPAPIYTPGTMKKFGDIEFVFVPKGKFIMGSKNDNPLAFDGEKPQHTVEIPYDYWIGRFPVTNEQFAAFVENAEYKYEMASDWRDRANHPVVNVAWYDAMEYCKWLNRAARGEAGDLVVRLPTEAEWEKTARGQDGNEWPWGNEFDATKCNSNEGGEGTTTPVGAYSPQGDSPYRAADMVGNVWEWCHSIFKPYPYQANDGREEESREDIRVLRGGAWDFDWDGARSAYRYDYRPDDSDDDFGFRVVVAPELS